MCRGGCRGQTLFPSFVAALKVKPNTDEEFKKEGALIMVSPRIWPTSLSSLVFHWLHGSFFDTGRRPCFVNPQCSFHSS